MLLSSCEKLLILSPFFVDTFTAAIAVRLHGTLFLCSETYSVKSQTCFYIDDSLLFFPIIINSGLYTANFFFVHAWP